MSVHEARLRIVGNLLEQYGEDRPLHLFLQEFYRAHRQMGSTDRRVVSGLVYNYYRVNNAFPKLPFEERLAAGCFLCEEQLSDTLGFLLGNYSSLPAEKLGSSLEEKLTLVGSGYPGFSLLSLFPFNSYLSDGIDKEVFAKSFLIRPKVWVRLRKPHADEVIAELEKEQIPYERDEEEPFCLGFRNGTRLDTLKTYGLGYFEIQDRSSQLTGKLIRPQEKEYWWDCCAGSGGKSLMLLDNTPHLRLTLSDIRPTIINNLKQRFLKAGIDRFNAFVLDLTDNAQLRQIRREFDGIIADVPCSGSGTWSRTPEMLSIFRESTLKEYRDRQIHIIQNISGFLKKEKNLVYITCSVFKKENEDMIEAITQKTGLKLLESQLIQGYDRQADTMFVSLLAK